MGGFGKKEEGGVFKEGRSRYPNTHNVNMDVK